MEIYIIRHSEAVELDNEIVEESFRYLSNAGRKKTIDVVSRLEELKVQFDVIISSPVVRAVQTAEIFANKLNHNCEIKTAIELIGGSTYSRFQQLLKRNSHYKRVAIVGHAPDVNNFTVAMIGKNNNKQLLINFKNTSICRVDYDVQEEAGKFIWFLKGDTLELINP
jgi:phosphohistidine phosphatase